MGNPGRPRGSNPIASVARGASRAFGVTSSGQVRRQSHKKKRYHGGYRMPAIVKEQIRSNQRFQDQIIVALMASAIGGHK